MFQKSIAVCAEGKWHVKSLGTGEGLLHAGTHRVTVVLGLNHGYGHARLLIEHIISPTSLSPRDLRAPHDDPTRRERHFFANLGLQVPSGGDKRGRDVFGTNITFAEVAIIHAKIAQWT